MSKTVPVSPVANRLRCQERELNYDENREDDHSSVLSCSSIPSLASEPEDTCQPFKFLVVSITD